MQPVRSVLNVGGQIRKARQVAGLSQVELAKRMNVAERTLQAWEANDRTPRQKGLASLARCLGQPESFFYTDETPMDPSREAA